MKNRIGKQTKKSSHGKLVRSVRDGDLRERYYQDGTVILVFYGTLKKDINRIAQREGITFRQALIGLFRSGLADREARLAGKAVAA